MDAVFDFSNQSNALHSNHTTQFLQCVFSSHQFLRNQNPVQTDFPVDSSSHNYCDRRLLASPVSHVMPWSLVCVTKLPPNATTASIYFLASQTFTRKQRKDETAVVLAFPLSVCGASYIVIFLYTPTAGPWQLVGEEARIKGGPMPKYRVRLKVFLVTEQASLCGKLKSM
jgi:hypothetical protein